jgi:Ca-activated chloride channel family protein
MSFYWPHSFWLLLIPFALAIREWRNRRVPGATNDHPKILRAEAGRSSLTVRPVSFRRGPNGPRWRLLLGLSLAITALARPQWGRIEEPVFDQAREILISLDLSRSMLSTDVKPTRLDRSRLLITSLLEQLKGERVGLVVFSGTAFLQSPLSSDYEILSEFLPQLGPDFLPEGGTNYNALLETSIAAFGASGAADRFLIVLSDGEAQTEDWHAHVDELKTKGIRVIALGVGTADGSMIPDGTGSFMKDERGAVVLSKLNNSTLRELAEKTGGVYTDASSWVDLSQLIQSTVNQGKRGEFKDVSRVRLAERYQWALAPALLFLIWSFWREFPVRPRPRALRFAQEGVKPLAVALLLFLILSPSSVFAAAAPAAADPLAAPLTKLVGQLSIRENISASDYASFAKSTLEYGERLQSSQQPVPPGPIHDALAGVKAGRSLDAKAADWTGLREKLEALLQKKDPPNEDDKKQDEKQKQPDKNKSAESKKDKSDQKQDQKNQEQKNDPSQSPKQDQNKDGSSSKDPSSKKDDQGDNGQSSREQPKDQPPKSGGQSAFGDMKDDQKTPPSPSDAPSSSTPPPGEMQQVGGASDKQKDQAAQLDPSLELPLQNLDQVRQQDSPARLYQLLQDPNSKTPARSGHNW